MNKHKLFPLLAATALLSACGNEPTADVAQETAPTVIANAILSGSNIEATGEAIAADGDGKILLKVNVKGLVAGEYGVHIHSIGNCEAPDYKSAGGHWNPAQAEHGLNNPKGAHKGDIPNLVVAENGTGSLEASIDASLAGETNSLLDADGASFMVHAGPDDLATDPSGNSGARIMCGVFANTKA